ncbi:hypothetical protein [Paracoccus aerodenitrificans]|uniref:hypothetical protein n=1 Tax=Paracoccus aerodenitrificans TaxID=3017781 RepID=UPI0022F05E43|nr:hypothetical protein [Paracoccus aerodenitrificans]
MPIGSLDGDGTISVSAFEAIVPSQELFFRGVRIGVEADAEYGPRGIYTLGADSAEAFVHSLDQLAAEKIDTTRFLQCELEVTAEEVSAVVFNAPNGKVSAAVKVDGVTCYLRRVRTRSRS